MQLYEEMYIRVQINMTLMHADITVRQHVNANKTCEFHNKTVIIILLEVGTIRNKGTKRRENVIHFNPNINSNNFSLLKVP